MSALDDDVAHQRMLDAARACWPELRVKELEAGRRLITAIMAGDTQAGIQALADSIDAQAAYVVCYQMRQH